MVILFRIPESDGYTDSNQNRKKIVIAKSTRINTFLQIYNMARLYLLVFLK